MGIPATLSSVPATTPYIQYIATGGQTVFPYPFPITQDSDLIVVVSGVTLGTDVGYAVSGQGNSTGGNVTFTLGQTAGAIITLFRDITIQRVSQIAQNSGFSSSVFNAEYNNIYLILQQLQDSLGFALQIPNTNNPAPVTLLDPLLYKNAFLSFDQYGNPTPAVTTDTVLTSAVIAQFLYPQTLAEQNATITPLPYAYDDIRRYGLISGDSTTGTRTANTAALAKLCNRSVLGPTGLIKWPNLSGNDTYYFNGFVLIGDGLHFDFGGCTLNCTRATNSVDADTAFLHMLHNVRLSNGNIELNYQSGGGGGNPGIVAAIGQGGRQGYPVGSILPATIYDSTFTDRAGNSVQMGRCILENIRVSLITNIAAATTGVYGGFTLGGFNNVVLDNVKIEGNNQGTTGWYYEFGFATNGTSTDQSQTSHAHNWFIRNYECKNLVTGNSAQGIALQMNGAYNIVVDGLYASGCTAAAVFGVGEAGFLVPWVGVDDFGSLSQYGQTPLTGTASAGRNIWVRNATGRVLGATGIVVVGIGATCGWDAAGITPWLPGTVYATNAIVYNGANKYTCSSGGTSRTYASDNTCTGPTGVGSGITDGSATWNYTATTGGTGFRQYAHGRVYFVNDIVLNGQYAYVCTTGGTSGSHQGPVGVGTGIADTDGSACVWSSIPTSTTAGAPLNSAFPMAVELLNITLDGFTLDSGTTGSLAGGYGVNINAGTAIVRNGVITNMLRGIVIDGDTGRVDIEGNKVLNCGNVVGIAIGNIPASKFTSPNRGPIGRIVGNEVCGISSAGSAGGFGISIVACQGLVIEDNILGYSIGRHGIAESTMQHGVYLNPFTGSAPFSNVVCRGNVMNLFSGGEGYALNSSSVSLGCVIDNPQGATISYTGPWEGVEQTWTPVLGCATTGDLVISYASGVQAGGYIKRGKLIEYWFNLQPSTFTHTTSSGAMKITGLPYAASTVSNKVHTGALAWSGITKASYSSVVAQIASAAQQLSLEASGSAQAAAVLAITDMPTAGSVILQGAGSYYTS